MGVYALIGRVIDGVSDVAIENGLVVVIDDTIKYAGEYNEKQIPENAEIIEAGSGTILPGFIDCHVHLCGEETAGGRSTRYDKLLGAAHEIGILLDAGFTGVRDMSANGFALARAVELGYVRGPRIMPGGRLLSITSGHCDIAGDATKEEVNKTNLTGRLCDGVDECILAARENFRQGAQFIKICATGGVSSITDNVDDVQFSFDEMKAIVDEAKRHGTYVAAHCTGNTGALQAVKAGVKCIEHGVMLQQETIDLMAENCVSLVTTLNISLNVANFPGLHPAVAKKAKLCAQANIKTIDMARKAGIRIAFGTDYSNSKNTPYAKNGREFESMVQAGMTEMEAIKAGTINAAHLMKYADRLGSLEVDKLADIVITDGNPLQDISCLADKEHIKLVMKNGVIEKLISSK
ncbi:MAG: amidohydrolase family protein [Clostridiaceae bacterium]|nr:amidohydrolase family protein [Clostridiaceae bacterium]